MDIQQRPIGGIEPYEKNAKLHTDDQVKKIVNSIREFGFNQPIVVDKEGVIIVGHGRYMAAHLIGMEMVPVLELDISEEKAKAYRLADNKLNESEWDMELVITELKELSPEMLDLTGFDKALVLDDKDKADNIPSGPSELRTQRGDIYTVDGHRIMCGDSTNPDDVARLMGEMKADMILTDPPYNVDYTGKTKDALKIENDHRSDDDFLKMLTDAFRNMDAHMKPGAVFYIWHADSEGLTFRKATHAVGWTVRQCLIWNKNSMVLGRQDYQWKHEPCLYGWKDGAAHLWNADRTQVTVLDFNRPSRSEEHPTMKPVDLLSYQISNNTKGEDIVLDTFLGSGSTLIAAQNGGRICYGMEIDPKYVDVCIQRYVDFTGRTTVEKNGVEEIWEVSDFPDNDDAADTTSDTNEETP